MSEGDWHKKTRLARVKYYQNKGYEVKSSHSDRKIQLSYGKSSRVTNLSDADIVVLKNSKIVKNRGDSINLFTEASNWNHKGN